MNIEEKILSKVDIYDCPLIKVEKWRVQLPNEKEADRQIVHHNGGACVVALTADGDVLLVEQWRTPFQRSLVELPAGKLDSVDEDRLSAAQRELREETGMRAEHWVHLTDMILSPGYLTEKISIFLATGLHQGEAEPDEDEFLHILRMPFSEAIDRAMQGKIQDAKTVTGLLMAARYLESEGEKIGEQD